MPPEMDWADTLADELLDISYYANANREMRRNLVANRLRMLKADAQSEAILTATEEMKKVFDEHGIGGGNK